MSRRPTVIEPIDRLRQLVVADGRPQAAIAEAAGFGDRRDLHQILTGRKLTVASARRVLAALRVVDPATGVQRPGRLADLD